MSTQNYQEMVNFYHNLTLYCAIAAIVFLAIAIFLFIKLRIPRVFGELTGRTAQKAINEMIAGGGSSGALASGKTGGNGSLQRKNKSGMLGTGNLRKNTSRASGRLNSTPISGNLVMEPTRDAGYITHPYTQSAAPMDTFDAFGSNETDVLDSFGSGETDVLNSPVRNDIEAGMQKNDIKMPVYQAPESETMILSQELKVNQTEFAILRSIVEIHTEEVI